MNAAQKKAVWVADIGETAVIRDGEGNQVAIFTHMNTRTGGRRDSDEVARNTRIAAASHDLLEALEWLVDILPDPELDNDELQRVWTKKARTAIAKATGAKP